MVLGYFISESVLLSILGYIYALFCHMRNFEKKYKKKFVVLPTIIYVKNFFFEGVVGVQPPKKIA